MDIPQPVESSSSLSVLLKPVEQSEDGSLTAYLHVRDRVYYVEQGQLKQGGGGDIPAALHLTPTTDGWHVEAETPIPGKWGTSIRGIFPEDLWPLIFNSPPIPYEDIETLVRKQAEAHFGLVFNPLENSFPSAVSTPTPAFRILTLTPTPTVDINILEPDVSAHVIINADQISISVDLYPSVSRPFQKGLLSAGWHVILFPRRNEQDILNLDARKSYLGYTSSEFYIEIPLEDVQQRFGDQRGFVYQIVNDTGEVFWQDEIYLDVGLTEEYVGYSDKVCPYDYPKDVLDGVIIGKPNLLSEKISPVFLPEDEFIHVKEPRCGFYALSYRYNLASALGVTSADEIELLDDELVIELFPFRQDGLYEAEQAERLSAHISGVSGILQVDFPHEWLDQVRDSDQKSYLKISDADGRVYKDLNLWFVPYQP